MQSMETIWEDFSKKIYAFIRSRVEDDPTADDLLQEVFVRIHQNIKSLHNNERLESWIYQIARNLIIDHYRQTRRYQQVGGSEELETMNVKDDKNPNPLRSAEQLEAARFLMDGLQALAPELKEAVILRDLEGMAYQEMADLLGIPEGTVKSRINRGRLELTKLLTKRRVQARVQI